MSPLDVPERAIQAFEKIHQLRVTIHDLPGSLTSALTQPRFQHIHPICRCVKASGGEIHCATFEILRLRANLHTLPEGRYHVCHAGLVEWVVPVYNKLELEWVIFAGARLPGPQLQSAHREPLTRWQKPPWNPKTHPLPAVDETEAELILEHLRQLGARLHAWAHPGEAPPPRGQSLDPAPKNLMTRRRTLIRRYIEAHQTQEIRLKDMAAELGVSEDRATHLVRECCGQTFRDMLVEARLKTAKELLRLSSLPVLEVALCSGFNEISHFNRLFRRRTGLTPGQYRRQAVSKLENAM